MSDQTPAMKAYLTRTFAFMGGYVALNLAAIFGAFDNLARPGAFLFALTVAAPIAGQIWATLMLMRDSDEYVGGIMAKRFIVAAGLAMAVCSAWGYAESYADAPHLPGWIIYPLFWATFGAVSPFVKRAH